MAILTQHRFSVTEYYRMAETGLLRPDARVELLDGRIIDMSPIGSFHGGATKFLNQCFARQAQDRYLVAVQDPVRLDDHSEPEPHLAGYQSRVVLAAGAQAHPLAFPDVLVDASELFGS